MDKEKLNTISQMQMLTVNMRGQIIHIFTNIEFLIDDIIIKTSFGDQKTYYKYMDILVRGEMTMNTKKQLFKICTDSYQEKHKIDLSEMTEKLHTVIDKRNKLAHWILDTSESGVGLFIEKKKIKLISSDKNRNKIEDYFDGHSMKNLESSVFQIMETLVKMQKQIDNDQSPEKPN